MSRELFTFFDPHPGTGGPTVPLPDAVRDAAGRMAGMTLTGTAALAWFRRAAAGLPGAWHFGLTLRRDSVSFAWSPGGLGTFPHHCWRVIRCVRVGSRREAA